jgi:hypothetical protein
MKRNLEHRKKLTMLRIKNNADLNNKENMNSVGIFNDKLLLIVMSWNNNGLDNVSCEYSRDEKQFLHIEPGL